MCIGSIPTSLRTSRREGSWREETADYDVVPTPDGTQKELKLLTGRYWNKGKYEAFQGEPIPEEDSLDGSLIHGFREDLSNEKTKDGLAKDLFPLTTEGQKDYDFTLLGQETQEGAASTTSVFSPRTRTNYLGGRGLHRCSGVSASESFHQTIAANSLRRADIPGYRSAGRWIQRRIQATGGRRVVSGNVRDGVPD